MCPSDQHALARRARTGSPSSIIPHCHSSPLNQLTSGSIPLSPALSATPRLLSASSRSPGRLSAPSSDSPAPASASASPFSVFTGWGAPPSASPAKHIVCASPFDSSAARAEDSVEVEAMSIDHSASSTSAPVASSSSLATVEDLMPSSVRGFVQFNRHSRLFTDEVLAWSQSPPTLDVNGEVSDALPAIRKRPLPETMVR